MKKLLLLLFLCSQAVALPITNPWQTIFFDSALDVQLQRPADCNSYLFGLEVGLQSTYIFDRKLEVDGELCDAAIDQTWSLVNMGILGFNVCDRIGIYGLVGTLRLGFETPASSFAYNFPTDGLEVLEVSGTKDIAATNAPIFDRNGLMSVMTDTSFAGGVGINALLWKCCSFALGGEAQYITSRPKVARSVLPTTSQNGAGVTAGGLDMNITYPVPTTLYPDKEITVCYDQWQIALAAAYAFCSNCGITFSPYGSVNWSYAHLTMDKALLTTEWDRSVDGQLSPPIVTQIFGPIPYNATLFNLKQQQAFGYTLGFTLFGCSDWNLNFEAQFLSQTAYTFSAAFQF